MWSCAGTRTSSQSDRRLATGLRAVNAGSVGMPHEGRPGAFWALLGPTVELRCTEYDVDAAVSGIRESAQWVRAAASDRAARATGSRRGDVVLREPAWRVATLALGGPTP